MNPADPSAPLRRLNELIDGLTKDSCENWKHLAINEVVDIFGEKSNEYKAIDNFRFYSLSYEQHTYETSKDNYFSKPKTGLVIGHDYTNIEDKKKLAHGLLNNLISKANSIKQKENDSYFE